MGECFRDGKIRVVQAHILSAERDLHRLAAGVDAAEHLLPFREVDLARFEVQDAADDGGKIALFQHHGRFIQHGEGEVFDAALGLDVAEHGDFFADVLRHRLVDARDDDVGRDAHALQFLDGVLRGFALEFARARNVGHERDVDEAAVVAPHLAGDLADGFDEGLALDVARRAADLGDDDVGVRRLADLIDEGLDLVGDVRDDLHRLTEIFARTLLVEHVPIDFARREVGELVEVLVDETLVVAEIEVGLCAVLRHEHFAVLIRAHGAGVDVDIGIELLRSDFIAAHLQETPQGCRRDALAEPRDDAACYKDIFRHLSFLL